MMDENHIQEVKDKLSKINEFIIGLDAELKLTAMNLLLPLYFDEKEIYSKPTTKPDAIINNDMDAGADVDEYKYFSSFEHDKPSDNVVMIAAWLYSQYGVYSITQDEIKEYAARLGITIAPRVDMTFGSVSRDGKKLFRQSGRGYEPTLPGEGHFKEFYKVKKGNKPRPIGEETKQV
jgi:hypothetical protein